MAYDNNQGGGFAPRQMFQGDWKCSKCEKEIKEMPFQPSSDRPIYCKDCYKEMRQSR